MFKRHTSRARRSARGRVGRRLFCERLEDRCLLAIYASADVPQAIPDQSTAVSTVDVGDSVTIDDVNVTLDVSHRRDQDLDVFLIAPDGTRVELFTDVGGGGDDFAGTTLDDEAANSIVDGSALFAGSYRPEGSLSALDGKDAQGTWTLELTDDKKRESGTLNSWSIEVSSSQPSLAINDVQLDEGDSGTTAFVFTVTRSGDTSATSSVDFATADGTASAVSDYASTSGTIQFLANEISKTITVQVNGDNTIEPDETIFVDLSSPTNAIIGDRQGLGTILDDDGHPIPNDPLFSEQWNLHNNGQTGGTFDADIDMPAAWSVTTGSMSTIVAIMDNGVDYTHEDLYLNVFLNQGEIPAALASTLADIDGDGLITFRDLNDGANATLVTDLNGTGFIDAGDLLADSNWEDGIDTDGNGFVDDLVGWDFHDNDNDPAPEEGKGHGTGVAGKLGAISNNGVGMTGVLWLVQMMPIRMQHTNTDRDINNAAAGLNYAVATGATISSNSWGDNTYSQAMYDAIDSARANGHLLVASAGNQSSDSDAIPRYPASYELDNVIAVAAVDHTDQLASFSNYGLVSVDVGAPSPNIQSTGPGNSYFSGAGTSSATPHVADTGQLVFSDPLVTEQSISIVANGDVNEEATETMFVDLTLEAGTALLADTSSQGTILNDDTSITISDDAVTEGDTAGRFIDEFVTSNASAQFNTLVFGPDGNLYAAPGTGPDGNSILRYDGATGEFIDIFVPKGIVTGVRDMIFRPDGMLYVASAYTNQVMRFDGATGDFVDIFIDGTADGLNEPDGMAFDSNGNLYVGGRLSNSVLRYDPTGAFVDAFVPGGGGGLSSPFGMEFGADGHLYVASGGSQDVKVFDAGTGALLRTIGSGDGNLAEPRDVSFGPDGHVYVTGGGSNNVARYDSVTGAFIDNFATPGSGGLSDSRALVFGADDNLYVTGIGNDSILRYGVASQTVFTVSLSAASALPVTVDFSTADGTAIADGDYSAMSGTVTFDPGVTSRTITVPTIDDALEESSETFVVNLSNPSSGAIADPQGVATIADDDTVPAGTKFFVADDGTNQTFEYDATGGALGSETWNLVSANSDPRGAAASADGSTVWVVDSDKRVYVYNGDGAAQGSWAAKGGLKTPQGIASDGTDIWIVDANGDKVLRYGGAASRTSGNQGASSTFSLAAGNPTGITTDGTTIWVVDSGTDRVYRYNTAGGSLGDWALDAANTSSSGATIDPSGSSTSIWIVDNGTDTVYEYHRDSGAFIGSFVLTPGNANPHGIADPPPAANPRPSVESTVQRPNRKGLMSLLAAARLDMSQLDPNAIVGSKIALGVTRHNDTTAGTLTHSALSSDLPPADPRDAICTRYGSDGMRQEEAELDEETIDSIFSDVCLLEDLVSLNRSPL